MAILKHLGQFWELCPFEGGVEEYIIIESTQGKLILVDRWKNQGTGKVNSTAVKRVDTRMFTGDSREYPPR